MLISALDEKSRGIFQLVSNLEVNWENLHICRIGLFQLSKIETIREYN